MRTLSFPPPPLLTVCRTSSRCLATAAKAAPAAAAVDPTISRLVDDISGLTLLQASDLVTLLKVRTATTHSCRTDPP